MKLHLSGRTSPDPEPGPLTRLTGSPIGGGAHGDGLEGLPAPAVPELEPSTPVPTRLQRLAAVVDRARPGRNGRNVRKWMETIGMVLIVFGFVCIVLGWYGAADSPYLYQEVPYLISGGLLGVALVIGGGVFVHCAWNMRKVEEDRRNALAIVRSVDRLERILRGLDEARHTEHTEQEEPAR